MIDLGNYDNKKIIFENENPDKLIDKFGKMFHFHKQQKGKNLQIITPKWMLRRLPIVLVQVKAGDPSKNVQNKICQIINSLYLSNKIIKQVYNHIKNSVLFLSSGNSRTCDFNGIVINLAEKINLKKNDKYVVLSNLSICYT